MDTTTTIAAVYVLLVIFTSTICADSKYIVYNTSERIVADKLNVHLVPHTHDDVGWLKTVDQYYVGSNNSIQGACVQNVLDSVVEALLADKNRKFIYVEMASIFSSSFNICFAVFLSNHFLSSQNVYGFTCRRFSSVGGMTKANGGMCMHDEAAPHYIDMIDQTTLGHRFIKREFGQTPRIGWQIDPFGHSAVQAYLLGAEVGFDSLFFGRIDYQDRAKRKSEKSLEVVWRGSKTFGSSAQIFAGAFPENYEPPSGFYFEVNDASPVVQDNADLFDYNVQERVNDFVAAAVSQANITRTNHIMWTMGTDFKYQYANSWFRNMDKLIHYVNMDGRVNALYSTPSIYTDSKYATKESWPIKTDDFFPYADRENAYWTGYFTSRPALKRYVRMMSGYYLAARQLEYFKGRSSSGPNTDTLADALAIAQHHDAVSGTSQQHVANDYEKRLSMGYMECPLLNVSYCPPSEVDLSPGKSLVIVIYNPLGWKREDVVRIPVVSEAVTVQDSSGREVESQLLPLSHASVDIRNYHVKAYLGKSPGDAPKYWLAFSASVPPLGYSSYLVSHTKTEGVSSTLSTVYTSQGSDNGTVEVGKGNLKLIYSLEEGKLTHFINGRSLVKEAIEQSYSFYLGHDGSDEDPQASGAYIFRPNGTFPINSEEVSLTVLQGPVLDEVHQRINPWIRQITRVYKGKEHAEVEFAVGPIPVDDGRGKEIATLISTTMKTNKTFYTDSNGRDFIKRVRDYRTDWDLQVKQPVAGNYYPINLGIYMEDSTKELSIMVDRSLGGSSILDGQIELMLHRRLLHDDGKGVGEPLNETVCVLDKCTGLIVQGSYYLRVDPLGEGAKWRRTFGQEIYSPFLLAFTEQDGDDWTSSHFSTFSALEPFYSLPDNIALITLQELDDGKVLLRLAHLYEVGEDKDLSVLANVELEKLFPAKKIRKVIETNLSANQERAAMEKKRLVWKVEGKLKYDLNQEDIRILSDFQSNVQQCVYNAQFKVFERLEYSYDVCESILLWEQVTYLGLFLSTVMFFQIRHLLRPPILQYRNMTTVLTREYLDARPDGWLDYAAKRIAQFGTTLSHPSVLNRSVSLIVEPGIGRFLFSEPGISGEITGSGAQGVSTYRGADKCYNRSLCEEHLNLILPSKPPFHPRQFRTCAVVGNSGDLLNTTFGEEIDSHDAVIRDNEAPVNEKYAKYVGRKRDFRLVVRGAARNMVSILNGSDNEVLIIKSVTHKDFNAMIKNIPNPVYLFQGIVLRRGAKGTGMKSVELALSMCDIVDIYGFTVDPGYTEWTRYFSTPRKGHNPLQGRAYYQLLECLGVIRIHSPMRAKRNQDWSDVPTREMIRRAQAAALRLKSSQAGQAGGLGPFGSCKVWGDAGPNNNGPTSGSPDMSETRKNSNYNKWEVLPFESLRKEAQEHYNQMEGVSLYKMDGNKLDDLVCVKHS
ncbi:hypothetical protein GIB67_018883 [Kingdonia uniflora]|uniref:alpha-mannosidase n=1 Tax=Kingdonia uniflora TaxID=39325 RepID=A0A7J7MYY9_9MAGN|nr:hypothetical protein GIB67_018883 [Kingdonia uniflora]